MLVLAIESSTDAAGVALADDLGTLAQATLGRGRRHAETVAPSIRSCCEAAGVKLAQVEAVVVDIGPGLFTGLRVGVGTAKALAYALGIPLVAVSSLEVLAQAASASTTSASASGPHCPAPAPPPPPYLPPPPPRLRTLISVFKGTDAFTNSKKMNLESSPSSSAAGCDQTIIAVLDARRGEVVSAEFSVSAVEAGGRQSLALARIGEDRLEAPAALASRLASRRANRRTEGWTADSTTLTLVGDGALRYAEILGNVQGARLGGRWLSSPPVAVVAEMGLELARLGDFQDPLTLAPRVREAGRRADQLDEPCPPSQCGPPS